MPADLRYFRYQDSGIPVNRRGFLVSGSLLWSCRGKPGEGYRGAAWVCFDDEPALAVVDLLAFSVRRRVSLSGKARRLVQHPDSSLPLLYACDYASGWMEEIDFRKERRVRGLQIPGPIAGVRRDSSARRLWVAADNPPRVVAIELGALHPGRPILLPSPPVQIDVSPREPRAAVTLASGEVAFVDLAAGRLAGVASIGSRLGAIRFRSDGRAAVAADLDRRLVCILDPESARVVVELPLALRPDHMWMKQDGGQIFITGEGRDAIAIVYPYRTEVAQTFLSGRKPGEMADSTAPAYLFVSNPQANSLTIFDIQTQKVVAVTQVGIQPGPIGVTPDQSYALVLNRGSGDMSVIRTASITPGREKRAPLFTMIPVGALPSHVLVVSA